MADSFYISQKIMEQPILNSHNKEEYPPMHTAEHILNATMVKLFGCPRSRNAHIERKKSKCDYILPSAPTEAQVLDIEARVNAVIDSHLDVSIEFVDVTRYHRRLISPSCPMMQVLP